MGNILRGERTSTEGTLAQLVRAVPQLEAAEREQTAHQVTVLEAVRTRCREGSVRHFAALAGVHSRHLTEVLAGRRKPSQVMLTQLAAALAEFVIESGSPLARFGR